MEEENIKRYIISCQLYYASMTQEVEMIQRDYDDYDSIFAKSTEQGAPAEIQQQLEQSAANIFESYLKKRKI